MGRNASSKPIGHRAAPHTAVRRAPIGHTTIHKGTMRCEHCSNHQMLRTPSEPSANTPPPSLYKVPTYSIRAGAAPRAPGGARHGGGNRAVTSQPRTGQSTSYADVKSLYGGAGGWDRCTDRTWAPRSANRHGEEQHRHTEHGSHTRRDKSEHSKQGGGAQQGRRGNQNSGNREPEWRGWESVCMGDSNNNGDGLASQSRRYRVQGQPLLNQHQVGGVSRSPDELFAQQEREPIRGRPAVRGKRTYGGRPGQHVEEQGTWASRTQKHSEAGYGWPVDRGAWTAKTVKRPLQQPAHPQYVNYWAPLTRKRHTMPHSAQPQHTNYWAPRTQKRHQQEHRPQRLAESSNATQHAKGRTGDCPGPVKEQQPDRRSHSGFLSELAPSPTPLHHIHTYPADMTVGGWGSAAPLDTWQQTYYGMPDHVVEPAPKHLAPLCNGRSILLLVTVLSISFVWMGTNWYAPVCRSGRR